MSASRFAGSSPPSTINLRRHVPIPAFVHSSDIRPRSRMSKRKQPRPRTAVHSIESGRHRKVPPLQFLCRTPLSKAPDSPAMECSPRACYQLIRDSTYTASACATTWDQDWSLSGLNPLHETHRLLARLPHLETHPLGPSPSHRTRSGDLLRPLIRSLLRAATSSRPREPCGRAR